MQAPMIVEAHPVDYFVHRRAAGGESLTVQACHLQRTPMTVSNTGSNLRIRFDRTPTMVGNLEHLHDDTFRAHWDDRRIEDAYVTFSLDHEGAIAEVRMQAISPLADFSFDYHDLLFRPVQKR